MGYYCNECEEDISPREFRYSTDNFGRALCRACQGKVTVMRTVRIGPRRESLSRPTPTWQEKKLYDCLIKRGVPAELQKWDGYKHIDIAIVEARVNIEVDGIQHNQDVRQALADLKRTFHSFKKNYVTIRIPNCLTRDEKTIEETADYIVEFLKASLEQLYDDVWD